MKTRFRGHASNNYVVSFIAFGILLAGFWSPVALSNQLFGKMSVYPERVVAGEGATVTVVVYDVNDRPIKGASVRLKSYAGRFLPGNANVIVGETDHSGSLGYQWISDESGARGVLEFSANISKPGYGGWTTQGTVIVDHPPLK